MRRALLVALALLVAMTLGRRLLLAAAGGSGSFTAPVPPPVLSMVMLYNGSQGTGTYDIGAATSTDSGATWTPYSLNPIIVHSGTWYDTLLVDPSLHWNGSEWTVYVAGHDGSNFSIGRWTNPNADLAANLATVNWSADAGNPVLTAPGGATDVNFPTTLYEDPITRIWYALWKTGGDIVMGYAEADAGGSISGVGEVLGLGSSGAFDDEQVLPAAAIKVGSTYYVYYAGASESSGSPLYRTGLATCTDPDDDATYSKVGVISAFSGVLVLSDGYHYQSNQMRSIVEDGDGGYIAFGSAFQPTEVPSSLHEVAWRSTSTDLVTWTAPVGPLIALGDGWDAVSAENPAVVVP